MDLYPAIDLRGGRCVRLYQGDYGQETVYGDDPAGVAASFAAAGATRIHVVDLDGARDGAPRNRAALEAIVALLQHAEAGRAQRALHGVGREQLDGQVRRQQQDVSPRPARTGAAGNRATLVDGVAGLVRRDVALLREVAVVLDALDPHGGPGRGVLDQLTSSV